ncbi:hypothetical protein JTF06_09505 [Desemzia sp. RIT804]|uniref:hypothetical protein n=1 Tax=Desemzia sp. RIT 804 TaxID=2810209 RepID=UPI001950A7AA|nr:hypothetical protein [Desemzia sp. RIT 804]MBM6615121.1 hypothetical protein [Desemzia sp. RIT 804]
MREIILLLSEMMNRIHDILMVGIGINMSDKELHFWVIGIIGLITFLIVFVLVKIIQLLKFNTTILSFIFTFVIMTVLVFAIEIQQAVSNSGNMEFADAVAGLWGFIVFFVFYAMIAGFFYGMHRLVKKKNRKHKLKKKEKVHSTKEPVVVAKVETDSVVLEEEEAEPIKYRTEVRKQRETSRQKSEH